MAHNLTQILNSEYRRHERQKSKAHQYLGRSLP
ncbi:hypothetical protein LCGC14_1441610 [marine sediment metagenome]|uniref:Uncharacterized protein n=1 Tax=marine sediment metagenome TaxID=412755 RepID=A0A0F9JL67_9ZZZZ